MLGDAIIVRITFAGHANRARPSLGLGHARVNESLALRFRRLLPIESVTFRSTPGAQLYVEVFGVAGHANQLAGRDAARRALDQKVAAFGEAERAKVYLHIASTLLTNASIVPNRSTASASCT